ncbi:MAG TPA: hypothetical protein VFC03_20790 [Acidimicrobiales bacterium]|nr:hypothetical protein [Acidimicrobiales bacterium]
MTMHSDFPVLYDYVRLAIQARWDHLIAAGWIGDQIVDLVLAHVEAPVTIDDYERFIGDIRTFPEWAWGSGPAGGRLPPLQADRQSDGRP